jgi:hypothetical protein
VPSFERGTVERASVLEIRERIGLQLERRSEEGKARARCSGGDRREETSVRSVRVDCDRIGVARALGENGLGGIRCERVRRPGPGGKPEHSNRSRGAAGIR